MKNKCNKILYILQNIAYDLSGLNRLYHSLQFCECVNRLHSRRKEYTGASQQIRILHKTNIKKYIFLVYCWPSGKYVHLLYMYSILGRGCFALITASIRRGMEVISLWHC